MKKENINQAIGEIMCHEKYKFLPHNLVGEVIRDFIKEMERLESE